MTTNKKVVPNTFIIGAAKSGTTSLAYWLNQHPDVIVSSPKEPNFFNIHYPKNDRGKRYEMLSSHFKDYSDQKVIIDSTTNYLPVEFVPDRIKDTCGDNCKIIFIVREPIERSYSEWSMYANFQHGRTIQYYDVAILKNLETFSPFKYELEGDYMETSNGRNGNYKFDFIEKGLYSTRIKKYIETFGRANVLILEYDYLKRDKDAFMKSVLNFIGVSLHDFNMDDKNIGDKKSMNGSAKDIMEKYPYVCRKLLDIYMPQVCELSFITGVDLVDLWGYNDLFNLKDERQMYLSSIRRLKYD